MHVHIMVCCIPYLLQIADLKVSFFFFFLFFTCFSFHFFS